MIKKLNIFFFSFFFYLIFINNLNANIQEKLITKLSNVQTLTFDFIQKIGEKEEIGKCFIKYPLLMKCNYQNFKEKVIISNGKTMAVIKKKYKKIYYYPIKKTPLFIILNKEKILDLIKNNKPTQIELNDIIYEFKGENSDNLKVFFDKKSLELKGWKTKDAYSNNVSFVIKNLKTNTQIVDDFFKIPREEDL